jgi:hypothetical protein
VNVLAEHIAALIIDLANNSQSRRISFFLADIPKMLEERYAVRVPTSLAEVACQSIQDVGGCKRLQSPLTGDMYQIDAADALYLFDPTSAPSSQTSLQHDAEYRRAHEEHPILNTYFHGGVPWIERIAVELQRRDLHEMESEVSEDIEENLAPASDRVVRLDHNNPMMEELSQGLDKVQELVRAENSNRIPDPEDKRRFVEQISSAARLLKLDKLSTRALAGLVLPVLTYLSLKFADEAIGTLAGRILELLGNLFGIKF